MIMDLEAAISLHSAASSVLFSQQLLPDDHWSYAVKLTADIFESKIQNEIDAGKTMFVRWIASPG